MWDEILLRDRSDVCPASYRGYTCLDLAFYRGLGNIEVDIVLKESDQIASLSESLEQDSIAIIPRSMKRHQRNPYCLGV